MISEEREPPTILKKLSKSYEHLDRFVFVIVVVVVIVIVIEPPTQQEL